MGDYAALKATINANIKANNNQEITGVVLNAVLNDMVDALAAGYLYKGIATPSTNPGTPDQDVFYIAGAGTYPNFGNAVIEDGYLGILAYRNATWTSSSVKVGKEVQIVNDLTTGGAYKALSAEQGKVLNEALASMAMRVSGKTLIIGTETPSSYVQEGLIFHLDGIDQGDTPDAWTDLVGDKAFAFTNCVSRDNHIEFPSDAWAYLTSAETISQSGATGTIEIVYEGDLSGANRFLFYPNQAGALMVAYASSLNGIIMRATTSAPVWTPKSVTGKSRLSLSSALGVQNLERLTQSGSNYFADLSSSAYIGRRSTSTSAQAFAGKIYSIRIYNRILTYDEVVQNQNYDAIRFGL